jgi:hypothetical protein
MSLDFSSDLEEGIWNDGDMESVFDGATRSYDLFEEEVEEEEGGRRGKK